MCVIYVFCLIVVPLPPDKTPFAVKINKIDYTALNDTVTNELEWI
jgi:hypothetical protein